jgi:PadR family transcriptional regulator PadR
VPAPFQLTYSTAAVLQALGSGYRYGFDIINVTGLASGSVYPILRRLERAGYVTAAWEDQTAAHRRQRPQRKYYELTGAGDVVRSEATRRFPGLERTVPAAPAEDNP